MIKKIAPFIVAGGIALTSCNAQHVQTPTTPPTQPPAQTQTYTLQGTVYHDYNGDGIKEENEPAIPGVEMGLMNPVPLFLLQKVKTDANGEYGLQVKKGIYTLSVDSNNVLGYNDQSYRYLNISNEEFRKITDPLELEVNSDMNKDIALMQGFLTLPFGPDKKNQFETIYFKDLDLREGYVRDWQGYPKTYDQHNGTDFMMEENTPILASAPGVVTIAEFGSVLGKQIQIRHTKYDGIEGSTTAYCHLNEYKVNIGDEVNRGDIIGLSGSSATSFPHLHFFFYINFNIDKFRGIAMDVYRDVNDTSSKSLWTVDNNPQYPNISNP